MEFLVDDDGLVGMKENKIRIHVQIGHMFIQLLKTHELLYDFMLSQKAHWDYVMYSGDYCSCMNERLTVVKKQYNGIFDEPT